MVIIEIVGRLAIIRNKVSFTYSYMVNSLKISYNSYIIVMIVI